MDCHHAISRLHRIARHASATLLGVLMVLPLQTQGQDAPCRIELVVDEDTSCFVVYDLPAHVRREVQQAANQQQPLAGIAVHVVEAGVAKRQSLFGSIEWIDDHLQFTPRFPLQAGLTYQVRLDAPLPKRTQAFSIDTKERKPSTKVVEVYPSQETVPENLLRFYVQFSEPMSRGEVYRRVRIVNAAGETVERAFLHLDEELWDRSGTRITLLFDPGRIKRELRPRAEIGSPLRSGREYALEVDAAWPDAEGTPLIQPFRKPFRVVAHDATCPDPAHWELKPGTAGTSEPLRVAFREPLDWAMLQHDLRVLSPTGDEVQGSVSIEADEQIWHFTPKAPWPAGEYRLRIATRLEDAAGNSIRKPFEVDLTRTFESPYPDRYTDRVFTIEP